MKKILLVQLLLLIFALPISFGQTLNTDGLWVQGDFNNWTSVKMDNQIYGGNTYLVSTIQVGSNGGTNGGTNLNFLFQNANYYNKWADQTTATNTITTYTWRINSGSNNVISSNLVASSYLTFKFKIVGSGYTNCPAVIFATTNQPVTIPSVSLVPSTPVAGQALTVNITTSGTPSAEEKIYVRYSTSDSWGSSDFVQATGSGTNWSAIIPGVNVAVNREFYVLTTTKTLTSSDHSNTDLYTINYNNNSEVNWALPVELTSFSASIKNKSVSLVWHTATEQNNHGFEVQKSEVRSQNNEWTKVGFVKGNGNSNSPKEYSFADNSATSGKYIYRLKQIDNDGKYEYSKEVEVDLGKPTTFALNQNYPNPFNPSTSIQYSVVGSQYVSLKVFNVLGKEVAVLVNEKQEPGTYTVDFTSANLSGGAYFYRLQAGEFVQTKKMILLK